jgi:hypothetical protein
MENQRAYRRFVCKFYSMNTIQKPKNRLFLILLSLGGMIFLWNGAMDLATHPTPRVGMDLGRLVVAAQFALALVWTMVQRSGWYPLSLIATLAASVLSLIDLATLPGLQRTLPIFQGMITLGILVFGYRLSRKGPTYD